MIRFGLQLPSFTFPELAEDQLFDRVVEIAIAAEESGFDSFFVMDHFQQIMGLGPPGEPMLEAYTLLAAVAARTSRLNLGALVTGVVYRNPALLAKMATTLDVVSKGRAILGIGAAWHEAEATEYGYDWPSTGERMDRLEDALRICRAMFTQERATVDGEYHRAVDALNFPRPIRAGGPRIMVGGMGERRTLRLVARYADACNLFGDVATIREKLAVLEGHCGEIGRDPGEVTKTRLGTLVIAPTTSEAEERSAPFIRHLVEGFGLPEEQARGGFTVGDPEAVCAQVQMFLEAGLDGMIFNMPPDTPAEDVVLAGRTLNERFGAG
jgi:F420-dependent oxidoreductase-like protein